MTRLNSIDAQLDTVESQVSALGLSLIGGDAQVVQSSAAALQRLAVECLQIRDHADQVQAVSPAHARRIQGLAYSMASMRENLLRQLAYIERALEIVVPATREQATYAGGGAYGKPVRQSGAFSVLAT